MDGATLWNLERELAVSGILYTIVFSSSYQTQGCSPKKNLWLMENPRGITRLGNKVMANWGERRKESLAQTTAIQSSTGESEGRPATTQSYNLAARTCVALRWGGAGSGQLARCQP